MPNQILNSQAGSGEPELVVTDTSGNITGADYSLF